MSNIFAASGPSLRGGGSGSHTARATLIAYDICSDQRRKRALRLIERFRCGGQKSMHECWLSIREAHSLAAELAELLDLSCDRALIAWPKLHAGIYCRVAKGAQAPFAALPSFPPARAAVISALPSGSWQLLAYDIVCPRRLQRVYGVLKKCAQHTQLSLFLLNLPRAQLQACVRSVSEILKSEDDLRLYAIDAPELLWQIGSARQPGLISALSTAQPSKPGSIWQQLRTRLSLAVRDTAKVSPAKSTPGGAP